MFVNILLKTENERINVKRQLELLGHIRSHLDLLNHNKVLQAECFHLIRPKSIFYFFLCLSSPFRTVKMLGFISTISFLLRK